MPFPALTRADTGRTANWAGRPLLLRQRFVVAPDDLGGVPGLPAPDDVLGAGDGADRVEDVEGVAVGDGEPDDGGGHEKGSEVVAGHPDVAAGGERRGFRAGGGGRARREAKPDATDRGGPRP